jgi:predicted nucleotidyltransferase
MATDIISKEEILNFLRENKGLLKEKYGIDKIMLFGSHARDEATSESDIDILIESKKKGFRKMLFVQKLLEERFNRKVDVIYIDSVNPYFMRFIRQELIYA